MKNADTTWQTQYGFNTSTQNDITGWASTNNLINATSHAASLVTKNYVYILGGYGLNGILNTIQRASFDANGNLSTWSNVGTLPVAMYAMGYVATKDRFYLVGGVSNSKYLLTVYSAPINEDGELGKFREEQLLPTAKIYPVCFVVKNKLYAIGGNSDIIYQATINNDGTLSNWTTMPNFTISFYFGTPLLIKDRIYIFGVCNGNNESRIYYTTYDIDGNIGSWNYLTNMPENIYGSVVVCTDNYVFSIGGYSRNSDKYTNASYKAPILPDGSIGSWTQINNGPIAAFFAQSAIVSNKIYFIGGFNYGSYLNTVYSATFTSGNIDYISHYS